MKKITAIFILLMSYLTASPVMAQGEIEVFDGTVLRWESGHLDEITYRLKPGHVFHTVSGDARGVSLVIEGDTIATADRFFLEPELRDDNIPVGNILVTNLHATVGGTVMAVQHIEGEGVPLDPREQSIELNINSPQNMGGRFVWKGLDIKHEGTHITADEISSNGLHIDLDEIQSELTPGKKTLAELATIRNLVITPSDHLTGGLFAALAADGKIVIDASVILFGQKLGESNNLGLTIDVSAKNMAQGSFSFEVSANDESLGTIRDITLKPEEDITEEDANLLLTLFLTQTNLKEAGLIVEDKGVLAPLKKYTFEQHGEDLPDAVLSILAATITSSAPATLEKISDPLRAFLEGGGTLTISLTPPSPQPLGTFLAIQQAPDAILQVLGFDAEHAH